MSVFSAIVSWGAGGNHYSKNSYLCLMKVLMFIIIFGRDNLPLLLVLKSSSDRRSETKAKLLGQYKEQELLIFRGVFGREECVRSCYMSSHGDSCENLMCLPETNDRHQ